MEEAKFSQVKLGNQWNKENDSVSCRSSRNTSEGVECRGEVNPLRGEAAAKANACSPARGEGQGVNSARVTAFRPETR